MIPISAVDINEEIEASVLEVLRSGMLAQGPKVAELENLFSEYSGVKHTVAVNNGTTALVLALQAHGLQPGDEVITTPFTFVATLNAILEAGATARFADIGDDFCIDPDAVASLVNENTKAIMPVHLYGLTADMDPLMATAKEHNLQVIEDSAQAHGATYNGQRAGSFGTGCFSLYATKNLAAGEGGLITTNDDELADRMRVLRNQGMRARYQYELAGHNYRMTDVAAAIVLPQLRKIDGLVESRRANAARLTEGLSDLAGITTPSEPAGRESVWHQYTVRVGADAKLGRDQLIEELQGRGVGCGIYYPKAVYDYDCYRGHSGVVFDPCPIAEQVAQEVVSLPVHPLLSSDDVDTVISTMRDLLG